MERKVFSLFLLFLELGQKSAICINDCSQNWYTGLEILENFQAMLGNIAQ